MLQSSEGLASHKATDQFSGKKDGVYRMLTMKPTLWGRLLLESKSALISAELQNGDYQIDRY